MSDIVNDQVHVKHVGYLHFLCNYSYTSQYSTIQKRIIKSKKLIYLHIHVVYLCHASLNNSHDNNLGSLKHEEITSMLALDNQQL